MIVAKRWVLQWQKVVLAFLLGGLLLTAAGHTARAQASVQFESVGVTYEFADQMTFSAQVIPSDGARLRSVTLFVQAEGEPQTRSFQFDVHPDQHYAFTFDLHESAFVPFGQVVFWYAADFDDAPSVLSQRYHFTYDDNRFPWQTLGGEQVSVHWYAGDAAFGQAALDIAQETVQRMQSLTPVAEPLHLDVYIYASYEDLGSALNSTEPVWIGSHAYPGLRVAMTAVTPGLEQRSMMEQQIPHEVMHVLIYQSVQGDYANVPIWLREGLASQAEIWPNPSYDEALQEASAGHALLHLSDLCQTFPLDSANAFLAYAEANSFVSWLRDTYGDAAMQTLLQAYGNGLGCSQGAMHAFGLPLDLLEYRWREDVLGERAWQAALRDLWPYLALLLVILLVPVWQYLLVREQ